MSDPVPAIREADATGAVAAIFADIRAVFGVGVVNLIWRHLAVFPGGSGTRNMLAAARRAGLVVFDFMAG